MGEFGILSEHLGYLLHRVDVAFMARIGSDIAHLGITPSRATAIVYIALREGCDQMALGSALGINRASTMKVVDELVALGAVERRPGRDRRSNALYLTAHGHRLRGEVERITGETEDRNFRVLTESEQHVLRGMLERLHRSHAEADDFARQEQQIDIRGVR